MVFSAHFEMLFWIPFLGRFGMDSESISLVFFYSLSYPWASAATRGWLPQTRARFDFWHASDVEPELVPAGLGTPTGLTVAEQVVVALTLTPESSRNVEFASDVVAANLYEASHTAKEIDNLYRILVELVERVCERCPEISRGPHWS